MAYLLDTNILLRLANGADASHGIADRAVTRLHLRGEILHVTPQVMIELHSSATRPVSARGLGLPVAEAERLAPIFAARFPLLEDTAAIYPAWRSLVSALGVIGRQVHDARLASVCHAHAVTHVLTFNVAHFQRLATHPPGLVVVDPATV